MDKKNTPISVLDVACVIHSDKYAWEYVDKLYNMVTRQLGLPIRFHVYTEAERHVPPHMIKHCLTNWPGIKGPRKSWWYKMQLFDPQHHAGPLLYFDLDCVLVRSIDWITELTPDRLWCLRDFKYLQSESVNVINSSVMWWDTTQYEYVWHKLNEETIEQVSRRYQGDQDFLHAIVPVADRRYFDDQLLQSYRWQTAEGGWDFKLRRPRVPGSRSKITEHCSVIVFHGYPKPHEVNDPEIVQHWC